MSDPIFKVGSLSITPKKQKDGEGVVFDSLRIQFDGLQARLVTTIDKYEAMQLRDALTKWLEES